MAKSEIQRVPTGVAGFDKIVEGGLPKNTISLVSGTPGTAKTIFAMEFIANGALKNKEKGVFITLEEDTKSLVRQFNRFGYDLKKLIDDGKIKIIEVDTSFKRGTPFQGSPTPNLLPN
jgi:circadian clock protein KaiC